MVGTAPTFCQANYAYADSSYVTPTGNLTSFSILTTSANTGNTLDFLVLRPQSPPADSNSGTSYTVVGHTGLVTLAGTGLETFPASIFVQSGDVIGWWLPGPFANCSLNGTGGSYGAGASSTDPSVGSTVTLSVPAFVNQDLNLEAEVTPGTACATPGQTIANGIDVEPGTICTIDGATINGPVDVDPGGRLVMTNSTVNGAFTSSGATGITLCGNNIKGAVTIDGSTGPVVVGSDDADCPVVTTTPRSAAADVNTISGSLTLKTNHDGIEVFGNRVGGSLVATGNAGAVDVESNHVAGAQIVH
jgi:hypothetical protein